MTTQETLVGVMGNADTGTRDSAPRTVSRRRFLASTTGMAATLAVPVAVRAAAVAPGALSASDFRKAMHSQFRAVALSGTEPVESSLTLTEVSAARNPHPRIDAAQAGERAFSLKFAVEQRGMAQDTYLVSHPALGEFAALLVPTGSGLNMRAEFHRL